MSFIKNPVQITTKRLAVANNNLDVRYPVVFGLPVPSAQEKINKTIVSLVNALIKKQGFYEEPKETTVQGWYEIKTNERGILSLSIGNYAYTYHHAHGLTIIKSLTFDTHTGRSYKLSGLFKPDSDYVKVLSDLIRKQIEQRELPLINPFTQIAPDQDYYIADKALIIYFQLYDLTPYYYGFPFFPISVYDIQDMVPDNSPLGLMAIND